MISPTSSSSLNDTAASFNSPTTVAFASTNAIAAIATTALAAPQSPSSPPSVTKADDISADIDILLKKGQTAGTGTDTHEQIISDLDKKIRDLELKAKNKRLISSVRIDLCKLSRISSEHYRKQKEKIYQLLIELIEKDEVEVYTSDDVVKMIVSLNDDLNPNNVQMLATDFRMLLAKTFCAAIELLLRHFQKNKNIDAITEELKLALIDTQNKFKRLNKAHRPAIKFANQMAYEVSKRITTDNRLWLEVILRASKFAASISSAWNQNIADFISNLVGAFSGLDDKLEKDWFDRLFALRNLVKQSPDKLQKVVTILHGWETLHTAELKKWKFYYGTLEILNDVIAEVKDEEVNVLEAALLGYSDNNGVKSAIIKDVTNSTSISEAAAKTASHIAVANSNSGKPISKSELSLVAANLPIAKIIPEKVMEAILNRLKSGVAHLVNFNGYVKKATVVTEKDKRDDKAIKDKASELSKLLIQKLSKSEKGRKLLLEQYQERGSSSPIYFMLKDVIPANSKAYEEWLKGDVSSKTANPISPGSRETEKKQVSEFHQAIKDKKVEVVGKFLSQNKSLVYAKDANNNTSLILAAQAGSLNICRLLIDNGASMYARGENSQNFLHNAAVMGHQYIINEYISEIELLNERDKDDKTTLMLAAENGYSAICEKLLKMAGDLKLLVDNKKRTLLHLGALSGNEEVVKLFKDAIGLEEIDEDENTPLLTAAKKGKHKICDMLLKAGAKANPDNNPCHALHLAINSYYPHVVKVLAEYPKLVNEVSLGTTPLIRAIDLGHIDICENLLAKNADPSIENEENMNAMHRAALSGNGEVITALLKKNYQDLAGKPVKDTGLTPLMLLAQSKEESIEGREALLKYGGELKVTDSKGFNALHHAAKHGRVCLIKRFLEIDPKLAASTTPKGLTPFMLAAQSGVEAVEALKLKSNVMAKDENGWTAMHFAASRGKVDIIRKLAEINKELVSEPNEKGETPLMLAAQKDLATYEALEALVKKEAMSTDMSKAKETIMHFAAYGGRIDVIGKLIKSNPDLIDSMLPGKSPLMVAAARGHAEASVILFKSSKDRLLADSRGCLGMHYAIENEQTGVINALLNANYPIEARAKEGLTPLMFAAEFAAKTEKNEACKLLLLRGADTIDRNGYTPLATCAKEGNLNRWAALLHSGARVHADIREGDRKENLLSSIYRKHFIDKTLENGISPLTVAAEFGNREMCRILLQANPKIIKAKNDKGWSAMHSAVLSENEGVMQLLADNDKDLINGKTEWGMTPLMLAAREGHKIACKMLLKLGAAILEREDWNAMHYAANKGRSEIIRLPDWRGTPERPINEEERKKMLNQKNQNSWTPLMLTIDEEHVDTCEALINEGADPALADDQGNNILHLSCEKKKPKMVEALVKFEKTKKLLNSQNGIGVTPIMIAEENEFRILFNAGADVNKEDQFGYTVMHTACEKGRKNVVEILLKDHRHLTKKENKANKTPFMLAKENKFLEICKMLTKPSQKDQKE